MVDRRIVMRLAARHTARVLGVLEAAIEPERFRAIRRIVLNEFGEEGLGQDLRDLEASGSAGAGKEWHRVGLRDRAD